MRNLAVDPRYALVGFVDTTKKVSMDALHDVMGTVTDEYPENLTYVYLDSTEMVGMMSQIGFSGVKQPVFAIVGLAGGELQERYAFPERSAATPDNILAFVAQFLNRTGGRKIRSELRTSAPTGPLFKLVGYDFRGVMMQPEVDVVVAVLHGSAEERNATLQLMETVAGEFAKQKQKTVQFTYIDGDLNDLPGLQKAEWESPVILLWPAEKEKTPLLFPGDMTPFQFMTMIRAHGKTAESFEIPEQFNDPPKEDDNL
jgi:hypothetical protein